MKLIMKVEVKQEQAEDEFNNFINTKYSGNRPKFESDIKAFTEQSLKRHMSGGVTVTELEIKFEEE